MYKCPKCQSDNITELQAYLAPKEKVGEEILHTWTPKDQETVAHIPTFDFECNDCHTKFSVGSDA